MSWERVEAWLEALRRHEEYSADYALSKRGIQAAMSVALSACNSQALAEAEHLPGEPYPRVTLVLASTVATAAVEWCAVLLGRGSELTLKVSARDSGVCALLVHYAREFDLPLEMTTDKSALDDADLVVAMGSDQTIETIAAALDEATRFLGFGHRFSVAWVPKDAATDPSTWLQLAIDLALHDSRGCMSPLAVFTDAESQRIIPLAQQAMREAASAIPRGAIAAIEGAQIRSRGALAKATGAAAGADSWSVHALPVDLFEPLALPRSMAIYTCADRQGAVQALAPYSGWLSVVGLPPGSSPAPWLSLGAERTCALGAMQRPPLIRLHNGVDWIRAALKPAT
jgi:hypothetical protein